MNSNGTASAASRCWRVEVEVLHLAPRPPRSPSGRPAGCRSSAPGCPCRRRTARRSGAAASAQRLAASSPIDDRHGRYDVEAGQVLAGASRARPRTWPSGSAGVLRGEEDGQPAVGDLAGQLEVLRPDRGEVDRDVVADRVHGEPQRLARAVGQRQRPVRRPRTAPSRGPAPSGRSRRTRGCGPAACRTARRASPRRPAARRRRGRAGTGRRRGCRGSPRSSRSCAGVRAGIWKTAEPMSMRSVCAATQASTVAASDP